MASETSNPSAELLPAYDVTICGGGLAGLALARQLRREHPSLSVLVIEKQGRPLPDACHKVGESSVELASQYFERLGMRDYLLDRHLIKHGLRFFVGGGDLPVEKRVEIGPMQEPIVNSYQLDRGRLETDLREMIEADGVHLREGWAVRDIDLRSADEPHTVSFENLATKQKLSVQTRWVVDATGRNALIRRRNKLTRGSRHRANASWYRIDGKFDINELVPKSALEFHEKAFASERWRSTNHFMGPGYWVWVIPLSTGKTSIGVVVHDELHPFETVRTIERTRDFIRKHEPVLAKGLEPHEPLDFLCLHDFSHNVGRAWSPDRWALVGEAGAFVDPLYSPGSDFIAFANSFTSELIRVDLEGGDLAVRSTELNLMYRALVGGNIEVYARAAPVYGHPQGMLMKLYWDNFTYWSYPCQYFLQSIYRLTGDDAARFAEVGQRFVELSGYMQGMLREWALLEPGGKQEGGSWGMPRFPSVLVDAHLALQDTMTPDETLAYMQGRLREAEEIAGELLMRVLGTLGDEKGRELVERAEIGRWQLKIERSRIEVEDTVGLTRRHQLSPIARDVERSLGRAPRSATQTGLTQMLGRLFVTAPERAHEHGLAEE